MDFNGSVNSEAISELFRLFSLMIHEEAYLEDQKAILSENTSFYPETAFAYLKNYQSFINHSISRERDGSQSVNIFDPSFLSQTPIEVTEKKFIAFENLLALLKFNDCNEENLADLESFKSFFFPSNDKGLDYQSFLSLFLPYSNRNAKKNCLKRKILYEVKTLESMNLDLKLQNLMAQILEDEIQLFKRMEDIKIKLANELHWDPVEAFNNLDQSSLTYLDIASLERFFQNFGEKFSSKDFQFLLKRINKNSEAEYIYFEDFKRLVLPFKTFYTQFDKVQSSQTQIFTKSQVMMERVDPAINDDKYLILKSTFRGDNNASRLSQMNSPSKIRQAVFDENALDQSKQLVFSTTQNSKYISKARPNVSVSNVLNASQKPVQNPAAHSTLYVSKNDGVAGKNMMYSRLPPNKIIQDLYGEHKFTNLAMNVHTPVKDFPFPNDQPTYNSQQIQKFEALVNPTTNFDNEKLLKAKMHEKNIYTPIRQNPQLLLSLNNEAAIKSQQFGSPLLYSRAKKPMFYSNTKEMQSSNINNSQRILPQSGNMQQSLNIVLNQSLHVSPQIQRKIFDGKEMQQSKILSASIPGNLSFNKSIGILNEPEMARKQMVENDQKGNISKPTPHLLI